MIQIAIIIGSTRPGRRAETVARWVDSVAQQHAVKRADVRFELVDLADYQLPLLDEPIPAVRGDYKHAHTKRWSAKIGAFDGFVFITPEYNHSTSGALKNAIDFLFAEWGDRAAGFVGYGGLGAARAVEHLRLILAEVKCATVRTQVALNKWSDLEMFTNPSAWTPSSAQVGTLTTMLDEVIAWSTALKGLRK